MERTNCIEVFFKNVDAFGLNKLKINEDFYMLKNN